VQVKAGGKKGPYLARCLANPDEDPPLQTTILHDEYSMNESNENKKPDALSNIRFPLQSQI
jgi:hypothetical protein